MANGTIRIDPDAAGADIAKLKAALTKLEEARNSIKKLQISAGEMRGQTGTAITEKCRELDAQLRTLETNLNYTIRLIRSAVLEYQEKDRQLADAIQRGGV